MHVLLLEDNEEGAQSMLRAFELRGWECTHARTLAEARAFLVLRDPVFTVGILDLNLPDGRGTDLLLEWGPDQPPLYARLPVAIYSGLPEDALKILTGMELRVPEEVRVFSKGDPFGLLDWLDEKAKEES